MIVWLLAGAAELPADDGWLLPAERATLAGLSHPKRHAEWRLGRWVAKQSLSTLLGTPPGEVEIRAGSDGAPFACCDGEPVAAALSISHRAGLGLCVAAAPRVAVGCDLELIESRATVFEEEWFTAAERRLVDAAPYDHDTAVTLIWSAKESALKALGSGLRRDTRTVVVEDVAGAAIAGWRRLLIRDLLGTQLEGWWRRDGQFVTSVAGPAMPAPPSRVPG